MGLLLIQVLRLEVLDVHADRGESWYGKTFHSHWFLTFLLIDDPWVLMAYFVIESFKMDAVLATFLAVLFFKVLVE